MWSSMFSGGGLNPRKMKKMMEHMGIEQEELEVEEIVMTLVNGEKLILKAVEGTKMEAKGQKKEKIVGRVRGGEETESKEKDVKIDKHEKYFLRKDEVGQLSRSLNEMTEDLYKRIDIAETFSSDLAHEIRNPLTSLKSASEVLENTSDNEKRKKGIIKKGTEIKKSFNTILLTLGK